jgi:hypothetical protein
MRETWQAQRRSVDDSVEKVITISDAQIRRAREAEARREQFRKRFAELVQRSGDVAHDMLLARSQDEWSLAFGFLLNHSLSHLGLAYASGDQRAIDAMLFNLKSLSDETAKAFPDRRMAIEPWQRSVDELGDPAQPNPDPKPHPNVETLSRIVLTLRDTGPGLRDFRSVFAPHGANLHIIRPA